MGLGVWSRQQEGSGVVVVHISGTDECRMGRGGLTPLARSVSYSGLYNLWRSPNVYESKRL